MLLYFPVPPEGVDRSNIRKVVGVQVWDVGQCATFHSRIWQYTVVRNF